MKHHTDTHTKADNIHQSTGFFYRQEVIRWILRIFYFCCAALLAIDFFIHRHTITDIEKLPTFYGLYGFIACVILVVIAKWLRIILIRGEDYYDQTEDSKEFLRKQNLELPETEYAKAGAANTDKESK